MMRLCSPSKLHTIISSLAFMLVIVFAVAKSDYLEQAKQMIIGHPPVINRSYTITTPALVQADDAQLYLALQSFNRDSVALAKITEASGLSLQEFDARVHMAFVINEGQLSVQFSSELEAEKLKPAYEHVVAEFKRFMLKQLSQNQAGLSE